MTTTVTAAPRADHDIRSAVEEELRWTPQIDDAAIGVAVASGVVTVTGEVRTIAQRIAVKNAVLRVRGVTVVADDVAVRYPGEPHTDTDIGRAVDHALAWNSAVPEGKVKAEVRDHAVTLTGTVKWDFQRHAAQQAVEHLMGVHRIDNEIKLDQRPSAPDTQVLIKNALIRNASLDADSIHVMADGGTVTLTGIVGSWLEKKQAALAAWGSPSVTAVRNNITVTGR
jgi:osmotically-inducible protein OsmY